MAGRPSRHEEWARAYVGPAMGDHVEAARIAGYTGSEQALRNAANRCLKHPSVRRILDAHRDALAAYEENRVETRTPLHEMTARVERGEPVHEVLTMRECAVLLSGMAMGMIQDPQPEGGEGPPRLSVRIRAIEKLAQLMGYNAPTKVDATVQEIPTVAPEVQAALLEYLRLRRDPEQRAAITAHVRQSLTVGS